MKPRSETMNDITEQQARQLMRKEHPRDRVKIWQAIWAVQRGMRTTHAVHRELTPTIGSIRGGSIVDACIEAGYLDSDGETLTITERGAKRLDLGTRIDDE